MSTAQVNDVLSNLRPIFFLATTSNISPFSNSDSLDCSLFGRLEDSRKVVVKLNNIDLYFDIIIDTIDSCDVVDIKSMDNNEIVTNTELLTYMTKKFMSKITYLNNMLRGYTDNKFNTNCHLKYDFARFTPYPYLFVRVHMATQSIRNTMMKFISSVNDQSGEKYVIYNNEYFSIYNVGREYNITLSGWNIIKRYTVTYKCDGKLTIIHCDVRDIVQTPLLPNRYPYVPGKEYNCWKYAAIDHTIKPLSDLSLNASAIMIHDFDIETYTTRFDKDGNRMIPLPDEKHDIITMLGGSFRWSNTAKPFMSFCIYIGMRTEHNLKCMDVNDVAADIVAYKVDSEQELLMKYCVLLNTYKPDIVNGFNSGAYDTPFVVNRTIAHNIFNYYLNALDVNSNIINKNSMAITGEHHKLAGRFINIQEIKLDNGVSNIMTINVPGIIMIDTMIILKKMMPGLAKWSLNYFLTEFNLPLKKDMPYKVLFDLYDIILGQNKFAKVDEEYTLGNAIEYCTRDAVACADIWLKKNIILVMRKNADTAFVDLSHAFHRANGDKCAKLLMAVSYKTHAVRYAKVERDKVKFPGAYVKNPEIRGIILNPLEELDVNSLYPSIIMAYNICNSKLVHTAEMAAKYREQGFKLNERHITISGKMYDAWYVSYQNNDANMGIIPTVLKYLIDMRKVIKKQLANHEKRLHLLLDAKARYQSGSDMSESDLEVIADEYNIYYNYSDVDALQLAVKTYMNTFYGVMGDRNQNSYDLRLAASVTSYGVELIKRAQALSVDNHFIVYYGDTDSIYMGLTTYYTAEIKRMYEHGAISLSDYYHKAITMSKIEGDNMRDKINVLFEEMSGTKRLTMSHDTTGFPSMMTCKKKYAYLKQEDNIRMTYVKFMPKLFKVKGLEMVKRGKSAKLVEIGNMILLRSLNYDNITKYLNNLDAVIVDGLTIAPIIDGVKLLVDDVAIGLDKRIRRLPENSDIYNFLYDIICDELDKLIASSGNNYDAFTKTAVYKPLRNNVTVKAYVNKLKSRGEPIPESGVRFNYVVVQMKNTIDQRGRNIKYKIGDQWESPEYARDHNLDLDLTYYMNNEVAGTLARFLSYMFMDDDDDNEDDVAEDESKSYKLAQNMVKKMIKERTLASVDNSILKKQMKNRYEEISKYIDTILNERYQGIFTMKMIDQIRNALRITKQFKEIATTDPIMMRNIADDSGDDDDIDTNVVEVDVVEDIIEDIIDDDISVDDKSIIKRLRTYITGNVYEEDLVNARAILEQYKHIKLTNKLYANMGPKNPLYSKSVQLFKDTASMRTRVDEMLLVLPTVDQIMSNLNVHEFAGYNDVLCRSKHTIIENYSIINAFMRDFKQYFGLLASNAEITYIIRNLYVK